LGWAGIVIGSHTRKPIFIHVPHNHVFLCRGEGGGDLISLASQSYSFSIFINEIWCVSW